MVAEGQVVDLQDRVQFEAEKFAKVDLFHSDRLLLGLNCLEPGQKQRVHAHGDQDKFYLVLDGVGEFTLGEAKQRVGEGGCVWAPAGVEHGVENEAEERLVLLVGIAPSPAAD